MKLKMMMSAVALVLMCFVITPFSFAFPVPISNPDFEISYGTLVPDSQYGNYYTGGISGWTTSSGLSGIWAPTETYLVTTSGNGNYVGYVMGGSIAQDLDWTVAKNAVYTLGVDIGNRSDLPFPDYSIALYAGSSALVSWLNPLTPTEGTFGNLALSYALTDNDFLSFGGMQLSLVIASNQNQLNFDNVRLSNDFNTANAPEPGTLFLLGSGLISVVGLCRNRFNKKA